MNLFTAVKNRITTRQAAEYYGMAVHGNGMCVCPFHNDKNPSMKVDSRFHCFGCQADGDVIDFTARLFDLSPVDAARKLACDFNIDSSLCSTTAEPVRPPKRPLTEKQLLTQAVNLYYDELLDERNRLTSWRDSFSPRYEDDEWDPRFMEAIMRLPSVEAKIDILLSNDDEDKKLLIKERIKETEAYMQEPIIKTPMYYESSGYAKDHNELDMFRNSHWANCACKDEIESAISRNFDGMHLQKECVTEVLDRYGTERVSVILAATVQVKAWDGRFSSSNKDWAFNVRTPNPTTPTGWDRRNDYAVNTHPAILDGFIHLFRKEIQEREKTSLRDQLKQPVANIRKTAPHIKSEQER